MSCRFFTKTDEGTETSALRWPANSVAHLFKGYSDSAAALLGVPSGIGEIAGDECEMDLPAFQDFCAQALSRYTSTSSAVLRSLLVGFLATSLALLERAGGRLPPGLPPEQLAAWTALRDQHGRLMLQ